MIRILLPVGVFHPKRIELLERVTNLQKRRFDDVDLVGAHRGDLLLEGFLESESRLVSAAERLSDRAIFHNQPQFHDVVTWLIADGETP